MAAHTDVHTLAGQQGEERRTWDRAAEKEWHGREREFS